MIALAPAECLCIFFILIVFKVFYSILFFVFRFVGSVLFCVASVLIGSQHSGVKPEESCDSVHEDEAIKTGSNADSNVKSESSIRSTKKGKVVTEKTPLVGRRPVNETSVGN